MCCQPPSSKKRRDDAPIVIEDDAAETAVKNNNVESSEESRLFISAPNQGASQSASYLPNTTAYQSTSTVIPSTKSTGNASVNLEAGSKQNDVRDLIARIRYIKGRLHRAEDEQRKKQMLKAILGLQKRVKALTKGMRNVKTDIAKKQEITTDRSDERGKATPGEELREVIHHTAFESQALDITDAESQAGHVTQNETGFGNKESRGAKRKLKKIVLHLALLEPKLSSIICKFMAGLK